MTQYKHTQYKHIHDIYLIQSLGLQRYEPHADTKGTHIFALSFVTHPSDSILYTTYCTCHVLALPYIHTRLGEQWIGLDWIGL